MNKNKDIHLIRLNPRLIQINKELLKPTNWDSKVIIEDLRDYIALTGLVKATPNLAIIDRKFVVTNGLPFILACLEAKPSVKEIICSVETKKEILEALKVEIVQPIELLDTFNVDVPYWATEIIAFSDILNPEQKQIIEEKVFQFYLEVSKNPTKYGGSFCSFDTFKWNQENRKISWKWKRSDKEGKHLIYFYNLVKELNGISEIKSLNGMVPF